MPSLIENQYYDEYNKLPIYELCFHSQELVQDIMTRTVEFANMVKALLQVVVGYDQQQYSLRKTRVEDLLKTFDLIFQRLRALGSVLHQHQLSLNEEFEIKREQPNDVNSTELNQLKKEKEELIAQVREKNQYVKLAIDQIADIMWQINSIQTLKQ